MGLRRLKVITENINFVLGMILYNKAASKNETQKQDAQLCHTLSYLIILTMLWTAMRTLVRSLSALPCLTSSSVRVELVATSVFMFTAYLVSKIPNTTSGTNCRHCLVNNLEGKAWLGQAGNQ